MLFNSLEFLFFLPVVFILYWFVFKGIKSRNLFLLAASYFFYAWWDWRYLSLILFCSVTNYLAGLFLMKTDVQKYRKTILTVCCLVSLGVLGVFKYYDFFVQSFVDAFSLFGVKLQSHTLNLILPVGISFYTFHTLSYTIDVYRRQFGPTKNIVSFFLFVSIFPLAMAGPIERATNLLPQIYKQRIFNYAMATDGLRQVLWGLFKKLIIADNCAVCVNSIFSSYDTLPASSLWLGAFLFTLQIYGDFSGYSDMALGIGKLLGFNFLRNFNYPYFSRDIAEFWRRWHISLTTWFRDYIYIPLGGSRVSKTVSIRNTFIIFLVSGFWHGANWTFLVWGFLHALLFIPLLISNKNRRFTDVVAANSIFPTIKEFFQMLSTFLFVMFLWVIFRAETISEATSYLIRMFDISSIAMAPSKALSAGWGWYFWIIAVFVVEWIARREQHGMVILTYIRYRSIRYTIYLLFILIFLYFSSTQPAQFIYFQF